ncbi:Trp biosynthesis-associated membrane protein [Zhihengliuella salsuginis]|uniref:Tryptophan-associated transmembrane protein (Trp_oprn_chp) n=1 Tax=Zhihengliuella salsuginis TaxID=578222 RepID=A0ABQ3GCM2_9MICC|nr:Trp biosynthesis-associated membrane protein [Zhihengliuella salsuginis]GHD01411.1 hypothetical protein GCM10008096_05500 [Zhihengliuella salsuginis]
MSRRAAVFTGLAGALLALLTVTRTWITVTPAESAIVQSTVVVPGSDAATSVSALAIVALAASISLSIAGRIARYIIAALLVAAGTGVGFAAASVLGDPESAAAGLVGEAAGTAQILADYETSAWPVVGIAAGVWIVVAGLLVAVSARRWADSRKYAAAGEQPAAPEAAADDDSRVDEIDGWDRLSRGEDPTR